MTTFSSSVHAGLQIHYIPKVLVRKIPIRTVTYVEARVHCGSRVQISNDTFESGSGRIICKERRVLPMGETRHDDVLVVVCNVFYTLSLIRWGG